MPRAMTRASHYSGTQAWELWLIIVFVSFYRVFRQFMDIQSRSTRKLTSFLRMLTCRSWYPFGYYNVYDHYRQHFPVIIQNNFAGNTNWGVYSTEYCWSLLLHWSLDELYFLWFDGIFRFKLLADWLHSHIGFNRSPGPYRFLAARTSTICPQFGPHRSRLFHFRQLWNVK